MTAKLARINRLYNVSVRDSLGGYNRFGIFPDSSSAIEALALWREEAAPSQPRLQGGHSPRRPALIQNNSAKRWRYMRPGDPEHTLTAVSVPDSRHGAPGALFAIARPGATAFARPWQLDIGENADCPFCRHHSSRHWALTAIPHFYRQVTMYDLMAKPPPRTWPDPDHPTGAHLTLERLADQPEIATLYRRQCAEERDTGQAVCLHLNLGYGAVRRSAP